MAKFRFRVEKNGKTKSGTLEAVDRSAAESRLASAGYTVLELSGEGGSGLQIQAGRTSGRPKIERAPSQGYKKSVVDVLEDVEMAPVRRNIGLVVLALVGLLVAIGYGLSNREPELARTDEPQYETVKLSIRGKVDPFAGGLTDIRLVFHMPEIPLDLERSEDFLATDGTYHLEYEFTSTKVPNYCTLTVEKEGFKSAKIERQMLKGDPLTATMPIARLYPE